MSGVDDVLKPKTVRIARVRIGAREWLDDANVVGEGCEKAVVVLVSV